MSRKWRRKLLYMEKNWDYCKWSCFKKWKFVTQNTSSSLFLTIDVVYKKYYSRSHNNKYMSCLGEVKLNAHLAPYAHSFNCRHFLTTVYYKLFKKNLLAFVRQTDMDFALKFSGDDMILPSKKEAERLRNVLQKCKVRYFNGHGHSILLVTFYMIPFFFYARVF